MSEFVVRRTTSSDPDFQALVEPLDQFLAVLNGDRNNFYAPHNKAAGLSTVVVAYVDGRPTGIGAFRPFEEGVEVKRMFVDPEARGKGVARAVLTALEDWAVEQGHQVARLETSRRLIPAVALYQSSGYAVIPNYGPYVGLDDSVCMEKRL